MSLLAAIIAGLILGWVLTRGYFCMYQGMANAIISRDYRIIRGSILGVVLTMIGFHALATLGIIELNPAPFYWLADIIGGIIFGIGMVLAGSCMGGIPMRAGRGLMGYFITLLGIGVGGWLIIFGWLKPIREALWKMSEVTVEGKVPTLASIFGVNPWVMVIILSAILLFVYQRLKSPQEKTEERFSLFKGLWGPVAIGVGFAIVELIAYGFGKTATGWETVPGTTSILRGILGQGFGWPEMSWPIVTVISVLIGVFISAVISRDFSIKFPTLRQAISLFFGGLFIAIGAVTASGGCNIAHTFGFLPQLSLSSVVVLFFMFFTAGTILKLKLKKEKIS
jgi:uncharacterized membrane protein YedE/YeeE